MQDNKKRKFNRLKPGQKVRAKLSLINWFTSHLSWSYGRHVYNDTAYSEGEKEIGVDDLDRIYALTRAKLSGKMPRGVISHYGARDWSERLKRHIDRSCVYVNFIFQTELGDVTDGMYVSEKDLELIGKKK